MATFEIKAWNPVSQEERVMVYDSSLSTLKWQDGTHILNGTITSPPVATPAKIEHSKKDLKTIKVQLGLSCNFECDYCSQRFVPHADSTNPDDVLPFVQNMSTWYQGGKDGLGEDTHFEFWGGEPFVYWKTMKPLVEAIVEKYPNSTRSVITNGSLLDMDKIEWLDKHGFWIGFSHDGPGQHVRGPDPLEDAKSKEAILQAFKILAPKNKFSFNAMINNKNVSRGDIERYFVNFIRDNLGEDWVQYVFIGEGGFVDAYDDGGMTNSLQDEEEEIKFRNLAYNELRESKVTRFMAVNDKVKSFLNGIYSGRRIESLPQKCGMDKSGAMAVDLNGNVLTCQNVSAVSNNPAGVSHKIGHVSDLENVKLDTSTHWSDREECPKCPVIHICKGACMFLSGDLWEASCNNAYSDNVVVFATAIESATGFVPMYIDGPLRQDRKDIFWWVNGKPEKTRKAKKIIPIIAA